MADGDVNIEEEAAKERRQIVRTLWQTRFWTWTGIIICLLAFVLEVRWALQGQRWFWFLAAFMVVLAAINVRSYVRAEASARRWLTSVDELEQIRLRLRTNLLTHGVPPEVAERIETLVANGEYQPATALVVEHFDIPPQREGES